MSFSPFVNSPHGHPNFNPVKGGKSVSSSEMAKNAKQPKPPDKPLMPYMRYSKKVWDEVRARFPDHKIWEISKIVGQMWRDLPEDQKQDYVDAFEAEKIEYNEQLKIYHNSPGYLSWIANLKTKEHEERESHKAKNKKAAAAGAGGHGLNSPQKPHDGRVSLVQTMEGELEDEDDYFSIKHLSAARFYRNHKLVAEIFGDAVVPDNRTNAVNRYQILRRQADSLAMHHQTLHQELLQIEEKFQERKRALLDSSEKFIGELNKRFASKPVDEASYQRMVERALEQIKRENGILPPVPAPQPVTASSQPTEATTTPAAEPTTESVEKAEKVEESSTNETSATTPSEEKETPTPTTEQQQPPSEQ